MTRNIFRQFGGGKYKIRRRETKENQTMRREAK